MLLRRLLVLLRPLPHTATPTTTTPAAACAARVAQESCDIGEISKAFFLTVLIPESVRLQ